jgi:zinc transport system substrate-binding protein
MNTLYNIVFAFLLTFSFGCGDTDKKGTNSDAERPVIVTSILPLAWWTEAICGNDADVIALLPANANPHTFELLPRQIEHASRADLLVVIGAGLEPWSEKLVANLRNPAARQLALSNGETLLQDSHDHHHGHGHDHVHALGNPHLWLDPMFAIRAVERIRDALVAAFPEREQVFQDNASRYIDSLHALHGEIAEVTATWRQRRFIADHSSWVYFAQQYSLIEAGVIEQQPGREISARELARLIQRMRNGGLKAIFADIRVNANSVNLLAKETDAGIAFLDPQGGILSSTSYIELMKKNLEIMDAVMQ